MIAAGLLDADKIGGRWLVHADSVERRREAQVQPGRLFSARRAWGLLFIAAGMRPDWLAPSELSRLRRRVREVSLEDLSPRLRSRAVLHGLRAHPSDLPRIAENSSLVRAGISAAPQYGVDLAPSAGMLDGYLPAKRLAPLVKKYALQPSPKPNLILRVVQGTWPFEAGIAMAPAVVVGLDLFESDDPRLRRAGRELLRRAR